MPTSHGPPDTTRQSCPCRVWCACVNWTIGQLLCVRWTDVTESMVTIRSPFFLDWFFFFSLLYAYVNCDFVLILILHCVILILILYCTTTYYYVLFHWRCMYVRYVLLNYTYLLTYLFTERYNALSSKAKIYRTRHRQDSFVESGMAMWISFYYKQAECVAWSNVLVSVRQFASLSLLFKR